MQIPQSTPLKGTLALAIFLSTFTADAGFSSRRLGISNVPVGGESSDKDILEIADSQGTSYPPINTPVPATDITKLRNHPTFAGKTNAEIQTKVVNIRRAVLCAIDLLRQSDPATAEGLQTNFRAGMICIGLAPATYRVGAAIRNDGREEFNLEPINIYKIPCTNLTEASPDLFDLANTLAHEGLHGRQNVMGWRGNPPLEVAKDRQCKEIEASQGEFDRATEMCRVIDHIASNGSLPSDARGLYARMGQALINENIGNNSGLQTAITAWRQKLRQIKARSGEVKTFRGAFKRAAELALTGSPDASAVLAGLRRHRLFQYYGDTNEFRPITRWYQSNVPRIVETPGQPARVEGSNEMRQLIPPMEEPMTFNVGSLDTICTGYIAEDRNLAMIGGIKIGSGPGGVDEGVVAAFDIDPVTGEILPATERVLLRSPEMAGGYLMNYNSFDDKFYAVQLDTNLICLLDDTNADGEPDVATPVGTLGRGPDDLDIGNFGFEDTDSIFADGFESGDVTSWSDPVHRASRPTGGTFSPLPREELRHDTNVRPGFDGALFGGNQAPHLIGTPGENFQLFKNDALISEGCFSPNGRANPILNDPFESGDTLRLVETSTGAESVPTQAETSIASRLRLQFDASIETDGGVTFGARLRLRQDPSQQVTINHGPGMDTIGDNTITPPPPNRFGTSFVDVPPSTDRTQFFQATGDPFTDLGLTDSEFTVTPGLPTVIDLAGDNRLPSTARFEFDSVSNPFGDPNRALSPNDYKFNPDGTLIATLPTFGSSLEFTYRVRVGQYVSPNLIATVLPNFNVDLLCNPVEVGSFGDVTFLEIYVITIGERDYPLYQFVLGPPEPIISPTQGCADLHWHKFNGNAFPFGFPVTAGIPDSVQSGCGYGTLTSLPVRPLIVSEASWDQFLLDHPK